MEKLHKFFRKLKAATIIEMVVVISIIIAIVGWVLYKIIAPSGLDNEGTIRGNLKTYVASVKNYHSETIANLKPVTFTKLFSIDETADDEGGLGGVASQCKYGPSVFNTKEIQFIEAFKKGTVGKTLKDEVNIQPVSSIQVLLSKMSPWKIMFIAGKKEDLANSSKSGFKSLGDFLYITLVEHQKANHADFMLKVGETTKYYNVAFTDSQWTVYDGMTKLSVLRDLLGDPNGNPNGLISLNDSMKTAMETVEGTECNPPEVGA